MKYWKPFLTAAAAVVAINGIANAQETVDGTFGYPASAHAISESCNGSCGNRGLLGHHFGSGNFKAKMDHYSALNAKKAQRNDAWPKPFACWDRTAYHQFWQPYLNNGLEQHCVIAADMFDAETNELTKMGVQRVAGIMQHVPQQDRQVLVQRVADDSTNQARLVSVKNTIDTYYAHLGVARLDLTNRIPTTVSGAYSAEVQQRRMDTLADPAIQAPTGGSVNAAVAGN